MSEIRRRHADVSKVKLFWTDVRYRKMGFRGMEVVFVRILQACLGPIEVQFQDGQG